jgi:hypothetical protein
MFITNEHTQIGQASSDIRPNYQFSIKRVHT